MHKPYLIPRRAVTRCNQIRNDIIFRYNGIPSGMSLQSSESDRFVNNLPQRNLTSILRNLKNIFWERVTYTKCVSMNNLSSNYITLSVFISTIPFYVNFYKQRKKNTKKNSLFEVCLSINGWVMISFCKMVYIVSDPSVKEVHSE